MSPRTLRSHRFTVMEIVFAISIVAIAMVPLAYGFAKQFREMKRAYHKSVAEQVLDGHREILARGDWRTYPLGKSTYVITNTTFQSLPAGETTLLLEKDGPSVRLTLEWNSPTVGVVTKHGEFTP